MNQSLPPQVIGIAGTNGSGKDTIGNILASEYNYLFVSVTDILRAELKRRGLPIAREYARQLSAEWRRQYGLGVLVDKAMETYKADRRNYAGVAMASLRNPGEVDSIHNYKGLVVWLDADPKVRYQRIQSNLALRGSERQLDDTKSFSQFMEEEAAEMYSPDKNDPSALSMIDVKEKSDIFISNDKGMAELKRQIRDLLGC